MKFSAPIVEAMKKYSAEKVLPFHTPGHKHGRGAHEFLKKLLTSEGFLQEVSLMEELDDLHTPQTCIKEAQNLAARLWHADNCIFFVNGTTSAVQTMIFGTLKVGDLVFVPRNAHRSVMSGLILSGAKPIFLPIEYDAEFNVPLNVRTETIEFAIKKYPQARAILLVSPNYYGVAADLEKISRIAHKNGMILLIDEAHGAHLQFYDGIKSAMDGGADISAQSTHKILGSLTQTSMLMIKNSIDVEKIRRAASILQTTSPNQILLASLDVARLQMEIDGVKKISDAILLAKKLREELKLINGLKIFENAGDFSLDATKITVNVRNLGLSGYEAEKILRWELKVQCELSDAENLLFLVTYADDERTISKLIEAMKKLPRREPKKNLSPLISKEISAAELSPRETFYAETEKIDLKSSIGRISAEEVTFYPPGVPILIPGEKISVEAVENINLAKKFGWKVFGASDLSLETLKVVRK